MNLVPEVFTSSDFIDDGGEPKSAKPNATHTNASSKMRRPATKNIETSDRGIQVTENLASHIERLKVLGAGILLALPSNGCSHSITAKVVENCRHTGIQCTMEKRFENFYGYLSFQSNTLDS